MKGNLCKKLLSLLLCLVLVLTMTAGHVYGEFDSASEVSASEPEHGSDGMVQNDSMPSGSEPVITVSKSEGSYESYGRYYCTKMPDVSVTDVDGDLLSVSAAKKNTKTGNEKFAEIKSLKEGGENTLVLDLSSYHIEGTVIITAEDAQGHIMETDFQFNHFLGGRNTFTIRPTCTEPEKTQMLYICSMCGIFFAPYAAVKVEGGDPALGHEYVEAEAVDKTLCGSKESVKVSPCKRCGLPVTKDGQLFSEKDHSDHRWTKKTKDAACMAEGMTYQECENCGAVKDLAMTPILGHRYGPWKYESEEANCMTGGVQKRECQLCGSVEKKTIPSNSGHRWTDKRVEVEKATCTKPAQVAYVCSVCGARKSQIESGKPLGHSYGDDGLCTTESKCTRCQEILPGRPYHSTVTRYDTDKHWRECVNPGCTYKADIEQHSGAAETGDCTKGWRCTGCTYSVAPASDAHQFQWVVTDDHYHYKECTNPGCTVKTAKAAHVGSRKTNDCTVENRCVECGHLIEAAKEQHDFSDNWIITTGRHSRQCKNPGCNQTTDAGYHDLQREPGSCANPLVCTVCGYIASNGLARHSFEGSTFTGDATGHWRTCQNHNCTVKDEVLPHTGGKATCSHLAHCQDCHTEYGNLDMNNHEGPVLLEKAKDPTETTEGYTGDRVCQQCHQVVEKGQTIPAIKKEHTEHHWVKEYDDSGSWEKCSECGIRQNEVAHSLSDWQSDGTNHWKYCSTCNYRTTEAPHIPGEHDEDCTTAVTCTVCQYEIVKAETGHDFSGSYAEDEQCHWFVCKNDGCSVTSKQVAHDFEDDGNCETPVYCKTCNYKVHDAQKHNWETDWHSEKEDHYQNCLNPGCTQKHREAHTPLPDDGLCTTPVLCSVCNLQLEEGNQEHNLGTTYYYNETGHYQKCQNEGCVYHTPESPHSGGSATCSTRALCGECGQHYGGYDRSVHSGGQVLKNYLEPTEDTEGYSGDYYCIGCDTLLESGKILDRLPASHQHDFNLHGSDDTHHWMYCSCGMIDPDSYVTHTYGEWQHDPVHHWRFCTDEFCVAMTQSEHTWDPGVETNHNTILHTCTLCEATYEEERAAKPVYGDANGNNSVDVNDAIFILKVTVKLETADEQISKIVDVNGNGQVDVADAIDVLKMIVRLIDHFQVEEKH